MFFSKENEPRFSACHTPSLYQQILSALPVQYIQKQISTPISGAQSSCLHLTQAVDSLQPGLPGPTWAHSPLISQREFLQSKSSSVTFAFKTLPIDRESPNPAGLLVNWPFYFWASEIPLWPLSIALPHHSSFCHSAFYSTGFSLSGALVSTDQVKTCPAITRPHFDLWSNANVSHKP